MAIVGIGKDETRSIGFDLPTLIETRLLVQANSGGGKSWLLRRLLEQSHGQVQQIVLDLEGEFQTLRQRFDYVIAGKGGDTPAQPSSAKLLARRLMELRVSAVCDLYELPALDRVRFVRLFLESLMSTPRKLWHPVLVVLDEAHHFCPEKGQKESAQAVIDLCTRGRKRGFLPVLATQRLAKLHKDACAELLNKLIGRTGMDIDQVRAADELGIRTKEERLLLRNCKPGEFRVYGPALRVGKKPEGGVVKVMVGPVKSVHPSVGSRQIEAPPTPTKAIMAVLGELADLPEQASKEARTLADTQRDLAEARRKITILHKQQPAPPCNHEAELVELREQIHNQTQKANALQGLIGRRMSDLRGIADGTDRDIETIQKAVRIVSTSPPTPARSKPQPLRAVESPKPDVQSPDETVTRPRQKLLDCLLAYEMLGLDSVHKASLAALAGCSPKSGGYGNNLGRLRASALIEYPGSGYVRLTDQGRKQAEPTIDFRSLQDLHDAWFQIVGAPRAKILRVAIEIYPGMISKAELANRIEVSASSGGFGNNLGRLRTLGAIDYPAPGHIQATSLVFPQGLA